MSLETEAKDGEVLASRNDINGKKIGFEVVNIIMKIIHMWHSCINVLHVITRDFQQRLRMVLVR